MQVRRLRGTSKGRQTVVASTAAGTTHVQNADSFSVRSLGPHSVWASAVLPVNTAFVRSRRQGENDGKKFPEAGYPKETPRCSHSVGACRDGSLLRLVATSRQQGNCRSAGKSLCFPKEHVNGERRCGCRFVDRERLHQFGGRLVGALLCG